MLDGAPIPYKAYRGSYDYKLMGEHGANLIITHDHGSTLYVRKPWDKEASLGNGQFDFQRVEDNLLRIHAADPKLRVILRVGCDPDHAWLDAHPETFWSITRRAGISRGDVSWALSAGIKSIPRHKKMGVTHASKNASNTSLRA